jgi:hypothetical protein
VGAAPNPRVYAETVVVPVWTLIVEPDGTVSPTVPERATFRDGDRIRPVAPHLELWALVGEPGSDSSTYRPVERGRES